MSVQFPTNDRENLADEVVDRHSGHCFMIASEHGADTVEDRTCTLSLIDNIIQRRTHIVYIGLCLGE